MKVIYLLFSLSLLFASCETDPTQISVENHLPGALLHEVYWGDIYLAPTIYPGQASAFYELYKYSDELDQNLPIRFKLEVNGNLVYLETIETFQLREEETKIVTIAESTPVTNSFFGK